MYQGSHREPPPPSAESWRRQTLFAGRADIAGKLPEPARNKLETLRAELRDAAALANGVYERLKTSREDRLLIEGRISDLLQRDNLAPSHPLVAAERSCLEKILAESRRISDEHTGRKAVADTHRALVSKVEAYIVKLAPAAITLAPVTPPKLVKGETPADAIIRLRAKIDELKADLQSSYDAPIHSSVAKEVVRRHIESLAEAGRPNVLATIEGRKPPRFAARRGGTLIGRGDDGRDFVSSTSDSIDAEATLCWLFKDQMIARLEAEIDLNADDASALSDEARAARITDCRRQILQAEREEEYFIEQATAGGQRILRRPDVDPRAVLSLSNDMPAGE